MQQNKNTRHTQGGNIFIIILVAILLFAALGYTFSRSMNKGTGNLTKQQAKIAAQEILNYARLVEGAVDRVRRNGCSESEIDFDNATVNGYSNTNTPTDRSCSIFNDNGGKINYASPPTSFFDSAYIGETYNSGDNIWGEYVFHQGTCVKGFGNDNCSGSNAQRKASNDLLFITYFLNKDICIALNTLLNNAQANTNPPQLSDSRFHTSSGGKFSGNFTSFTRLMTPSDVDNHDSYCIEASSVAPTGPGTYHFYHVLLAR